MNANRRVNGWILLCQLDRFESTRNDDEAATKNTPEVKTHAAVVSSRKGISGLFWRALAGLKRIFGWSKKIVGARTNSSTMPKTEPGAPDARDAITRAHAKQLVGLAFSGGGIRSATFNLGVLQSL